MRTATSRRSESSSGSLVLRAGNRDVRRPAGPLLDATLMSALGCAAAGLALGELALAPTWPEHG